MEYGKDNLKIENPELRASILSQVFFVWTIRFFKKLLNHTWNFSDLPVLPDDKADILGQKLEHYWKQEIELANRSKKTPLLWNALQKMFGNKKRIYDLILFGTYVIMRPGLCILLAILIRTFRKEYNFCQRCKFGAAFVIISFIIFITEHLVHFQLNNIGSRMRVALSSLLYKKVLKLNLESLELAPVKKFSKIVSDELFFIHDMACSGSKACICLLQMVVIIIAMWTITGFSSLTGLLFIIIVVIPINSICCIFQKTQKIKIKKYSKIRIKFMEEIVEGMKIIKTNNWETPFEKIIKLKRQLELKEISRYFSYKFTFYSFFIHKFCTFLSIISLFFYNSFYPELVFCCSQFLFVAISSAMYCIPKSLIVHANVYDTLNSITQLLLMKEIKSTDAVPYEKPEIKLERLCVHWSADDEFDLRVEDIRIKPGSLCIVIGPNNSGKTTFLKLILNELHPRCGKVQTKGSVSYCSQNPWLYGSTIRNNILFGRLYKESRYKNIVNVCGLLPDFSQFMNGDNSGIGVGGVVLGEDQKSRINLARAVYHEADIYLIDDVLSLMDSKIGNKLFDDCFTRYLARKTRVIVTNQIQFLDKADQILVVNESRAQIFDNLTQVKDNKIDLYSWIEDQNGHGKIKSQNLENKLEKLNIKDTFSYTSNGRVKYFGEFIKYIKSGKMVILICFLLIFVHIVIICCDYWLAYWSSQSYLKPTQSAITSSLLTLPFSNNSNTIGLKEVDINEAQNDLIVYTSLILCSFVLTAILYAVLTIFFSNAAKILHEKLIHSVLQAPMQLFYTNSVKALFKIFTLDVEIMDIKFPEAVEETVQIFLFSIGCLVLVYISECILLFSIVLVIPYVLIQKCQLRISRILNNLENTARIPIMGHITDTLDGILTIRVCNEQEKSTAQFEKFLDNNTSLYRLNMACSFSFAMWMDLVCNMYLTLTIFGLILIHEFVHTVDPCYAGLAIFQAYQLSEILRLGSRKLNQSAQDYLSVKKVIDYSKIPEENCNNKRYTNNFEFYNKFKQSVITQPIYRQPPKNWPGKGEIEFKNASLLYFDRIQALDDVNIKIKGHEKIGVVGKLGAGKSSLVSAILNLFDFDGTILIDNVDIKYIPLEILRKHISVIQKPTLFSGCIAYNLDPNGEFPEEKLWAVLEEVNLKKVVDSLGELANSRTTQFSKGQILLLCLARAILQKNKIIILDEVVANLDDETEDLFHELLKKHFAECTVIYITSNLHPAIMECDRVLVMENGQVMDYDHPFSLLESEGAFFKLVSEAGKSVYSHYRHLAYQKYVAKFRSNEFNNI